MPIPLLRSVLLTLALTGSMSSFACPCDGDDDAGTLTDLEPPRPGEQPDALTTTDRDIAQVLARIRAAEARAAAEESAAR